MIHNCKINLEHNLVANVHPSTLHTPKFMHYLVMPTLNNSYFILNNCVQFPMQITLTSQSIRSAAVYLHWNPVFILDVRARNCDHPTISFGSRLH